MILIGTGGHAKVVYDAIVSTDKCVAKVYDDNVKEWLAFKEIETIPRQTELEHPYIISIGHNQTRKKVSKEIIGDCISVVHDGAFVADGVQISGGSCVMVGTIIQPGCKVGRHCIVNTSSSIDHDCELADFVHISPNTTLCGNVYVGEGTQIGAGSVVIPGIRIGKWAVIGAGAVVVKDIPDGATVVGNPGRIIKTNPEI